MTWDNKLFNYTPQESLANWQAVEEVAHRLPSALLTNLVASTVKRNFIVAGAAGFAVGTGYQVLSRGYAAYLRGDDLKSLDTWLPILETSALDSFRTLMCLGIGTLGYRFIPNNPILRNVIVNEVVGFSYTGLDLLLYGQTDLEWTDPLVWGVSGFIGGTISPRLKNRALTEFGFEYCREVGEEVGQTCAKRYVRDEKVTMTTAEMIMTTGMAMQEGGSKGVDLVRGAVNQVDLYRSGVPGRYHSILGNGIRTPRDIQTAIDFLCWVDPENQEHYQTCASIPHNFTDMGSHTYGGASLKITDLFFRGENGLAQNIALNHTLPIGPATLRHEYRHADRREKEADRPPIKEDGTFKAHYDSVVDFSMDEEARAFEAEIEFAQKFWQKTGRNLYDLASEEKMGLQMKAWTRIWIENGREGLKQVLNNSGYITLKISSLKHAVLLRTGMVDQLASKPEPMGEKESVEAILEELKSFKGMVEPIIRAQGLNIANVLLAPKAKHLLTKCWEIAQKNQLDKNDYEFLKTDFDKIVEVVGMVFGDPRPVWVDKPYVAAWEGGEIDSLFHNPPLSPLTLRGGELGSFVFKLQFLGSAVHNADGFLI